MRLADATTLFRTALVFVVAYLVLIKFYAIVTVAIIAIAMLLDAVDGYFAVWEVSKGKVGFIKYV
ncbi:MAG: CDP-alcohol phosphatidyltransferase family protein, partial [Candidatus Micrarchaeaceae archaeon]